MVFGDGKMFYQIQPKRDVYFRKVKTGHNSINTHLHSFFELHCCTEGMLLLEIQGRRCVVPAGHAAIIFPYQPHSYTGSGGKGFFFTFDPDLIGLFAGEFANAVPKNSVFPFTYAIDSITESSSVYAIKSFLYAMCACAAQLEYTDIGVDGRGLLEKLFLMVEEHYRDCTFSLKRLSEMLEYDYGYLSKYFHKMSGMKFVEYLNQRRVAFARDLLHSGGVIEIADAAFASGYSSVRSFNRNFKRIEGKTPREYVALSRI